MAVPVQMALRGPLLILMAVLAVTAVLMALAVSEVSLAAYSVPQALMGAMATVVLAAMVVMASRLQSLA